MDNPTDQNSNGVYINDRKVGGSLTITEGEKSVIFNVKREHIVSDKSEEYHLGYMDGLKAAIEAIEKHRKQGTG